MEVPISGIGQPAAVTSHGKSERYVHPSNDGEYAGSHELATMSRSNFTCNAAHAGNRAGKPSSPKRGRSFYPLSDNRSGAKPRGLFFVAF